MSRVASEESNPQPDVERLFEPLITDAVVQDFARLLPQLTDKADREPELIRVKLEAAVRNPEGMVAIAYDGEGRVQGTATANMHRFGPGWVDDVVVDESMRGRGTGEALMEELHEWFVARDIGEVLLTSTPDREAAGRLYARLGYVTLDDMRVCEKDISHHAGRVGADFYDSKDRKAIIRNAVGQATICRIPTGAKARIQQPDQEDQVLMYDLEVWLAAKGMKSVSYIGPADVEPYPGYVPRDTHVFRREL